jgi:tellurite resistance protein TerC
MSLERRDDTDTRRHGRVKRLARIVFGFTLLAIGIALLVLPGPGWITIALGLALLASEYVWARKLLDRLKQVGGKLKRSPPARRDTPASPHR